MLVNLDDWQKEILEYEGNVLLAKGRRIGATHLMAMKAVEYLMTHKNNHPESQIICVSLTEDQAELIISFAVEYATAKYSKFIGKKLDKPTKNKLTLVVDRNKRILRARPVGTTGDAARGYDAQILMVDEAPRMPKQFWSAATPMLATNAGKMWIWGTFYGVDNYFYERYDEIEDKKIENPRFKCWNKNTEEVFYNRPISETWTELQRKENIEFLKNEKKEKTADEYGEEYLAIPNHNFKQFFNDEWIESVCKAKKNMQIYGGVHYLGVDLARMGGDQIAYSVLNRDASGKCIQVEKITEVYKFTPDTERKIIDVATIWNVKKIGIDAGAGTLGVSVLDHLRETDIKNKVVPMNNREIIIEKDDDGNEITQHFFKQDMYFNLKSMGEHNQLVLLDDPEVRLSLKSVQMEIYVAANGERKLRLYGKFTHIVESLIRAAQLAKEKSLRLWGAYS